MGGIQKPFLFQIFEFKAQRPAGYNGDVCKGYIIHFNTSYSMVYHITPLS